MTDFQNIDGYPVFDQIQGLEPVESILDVFLGKKDKRNIFIQHENQMIEFEQIAIFPIDCLLYVLLRPVTKMEGIGEDEMILFYIDIDDNGWEVLKVEEDEDIAKLAYQIYLKMIEDARAEREGTL